MPDNDLIDELMLRWEAARQQGQNPRPEELCAEHPQFVVEVGRQIHAVLSMERVLGVNQQDNVATVPSRGPEGGALPLTWLADGTPLDVDGNAREIEWRPEGRGFVKLSVIDAKGRTDRVTVRLR